MIRLRWNDNTKRDEPIAVIKAGVRIFSDGREPAAKGQVGPSLAATRRNARAMRLLAMDYQREGGADNILRADRWLTSATLVGDLTAAHELARFLAAEPAGTRNPRERAKLLFTALVEEHDSDEARVDLARWYLIADNEMKAPEKAEPLLP